MLAAQEPARAAGVGLWGACARSPGPIVTVTATVAPSPQTNCDSSHPTLCIPPPPPGLDCGEIGYRNFVVLPPDPHRFAGDKDGVGCES